MKKLLLILIAVMCSCSLMAQYGSTSHSTRKAVGIGLKGGLGLPSYAYFGDADKSALGYDSIMNRIKPLYGVFVEIPIGDHFYVSPEVSLVNRGDARLYESSVWNTMVRYQASVSYLELRVPVSMVLPVGEVVQPYVFAAPTFGLALPMGDITLQSFDNPQSINHSVAIDSSNMAPYDLGLTAGVGMRFNMDFSRFSLVVKLEAAYSHGLLDTYSVAEHNDQAPAANVNAYNVIGQRLNRGFECALSIVLPLKFAPGDACSNWSKDVYPKGRRGQPRGF